jgi:putative membrane protein
LPVKRGPLVAATALLIGAWTVAALPLGITGHMVAHMVTVAVAAPLLAWGVAGSRFDPAARWPAIVTPLAMTLVELAVVWGWHLPAMRAFAATLPLALVLEQASFLAAGLLLWSAVLGTQAGHGAAGVGALLLTSMHMTLLGVLIGLAPRPLYGGHGHPAGLTTLADQQLGGVVMLMVGAACYLIGGLVMLGGLLRERSPA